MIGNYYYGTGRRKTSVARVFIKAGSGKFVVNEKPVDEFFTRETGRMVVRQPLVLTNHQATFDIMVNVYGGGESGQRDARWQQGDTKTCLNKFVRCHESSRPHADQRRRRGRADLAKIVHLGKLHAERIGAGFGVRRQAILNLREGFLRT